MMSFIYLAKKMFKCLKVDTSDNKAQEKIDKTV